MQVDSLNYLPFRCECIGRHAFDQIHKKAGAWALQLKMVENYRVPLLDTAGELICQRTQHFYTIWFDLSHRAQYINIEKRLSFSYHHHFILSFFSAFCLLFKSSRLATSV